jgi:hypothetical protein
MTHAELTMTRDGACIFVHMSDHGGVSTPVTSPLTDSEQPIDVPTTLGRPALEGGPTSKPVTDDNRVSSEDARKTMWLHGLTGLLLGLVLATAITEFRRQRSAMPEFPILPQPSRGQTVSLLHINDVYELNALAWNQGGLARVATLRKVYFWIC